MCRIRWLGHVTILLHQLYQPKKPVTVLASFTSRTDSSKALQRVLCIWYPVQFQNNKIQALINSGSTVNAMVSAYTAKLDLITRKTSVGAQKIHASRLETHGMVLARFFFRDSLGKVWFFKETFLLADNSIEVVLGMFFLAFSNINFHFGAEKLTWRSYTTVEALPTTSRVELIDKKEFAKAAIDENSETFVVYMLALDVAESLIHPF